MIKKTVVIGAMLLCGSAFAGQQYYACPWALYCGMGGSGDPAKYGCEHLDPQWEIHHVPVLVGKHEQIDYFKSEGTIWSDGSHHPEKFNSAECIYRVSWDSSNEGYLALDIAPGKPKYTAVNVNPGEPAWGFSDNGTMAGCNPKNGSVACLFIQTPVPSKQ